MLRREQGLSPYLDKLGKKALDLQLGVDEILASINKLDLQRQRRARPSGRVNH